MAGRGPRSGRLSARDLRAGSAPRVRAACGGRLESGWPTGVDVVAGRVRTATDRGSAGAARAAAATRDSGDLHRLVRGARTWSGERSVGGRAFAVAARPGEDAARAHGLGDSRARSARRSTGGPRA